MIWAKEETMSRAEIEAIQLSRLKDTVNRVYEKVPAYRAKMEEAGVRPEHIQTLKDLQKLPSGTSQWTGEGRGCGGSVLYWQYPEAADVYEGF